METCELLHHHASYLFAGPDAQSTRPLLNSVPLEQRLLAAFMTCASSQSVVPQIRSMETPRQFGSISPAKACSSSLTLDIVEVLFFTAAS